MLHANCLCFAQCFLSIVSQLGAIIPMGICGKRHNGRYVVDGISMNNISGTTSNSERISKAFCSFWQGVVIPTIRVQHLRTSPDHPCTRACIRVIPRVSTAFAKTIMRRFFLNAWESISPFSPFSFPSFVCLGSRRSRSRAVLWLFLWLCSKHCNVLPLFDVLLYHLLT